MAHVGLLLIALCVLHISKYMFDRKDTVISTCFTWLGFCFVFVLFCLASLSV